LPDREFRTAKAHNLEKATKDAWGIWRNSLTNRACDEYFDHTRKRGIKTVLRYPVKLSKDTNDTILVDVPDIPEAHTFGEDREEALLRAPDAIESALMCYIDLRREIPVPRATSKGPFVTLPALTQAKLALYAAMRTNIEMPATMPLRRSEGSGEHSGPVAWAASSCT
jgi:predicted RNase H-like HicB family nuclease